jgi:hypothetical protein
MLRYLSLHPYFMLPLFIWVVPTAYHYIYFRAVKLVINFTMICMIFSMVSVPP